MSYIQSNLRKKMFLLLLRLKNHILILILFIETTFSPGSQYYAYVNISVDSIHVTLETEQR